MEQGKKISPQDNWRTEANWNLHEVNRSWIASRGYLAKLICESIPEGPSYMVKLYMEQKEPSIMMPVYKTVKVERIDKLVKKLSLMAYRNFQQVPL